MPDMSDLRVVNADCPYRDPDHPGNKLRPKIRCVGCGKMGCVTAWGPWCFDCNVQRMDRIDGFLKSELKWMRG